MSTYGLPANLQARMLRMRTEVAFALYDRATRHVVSGKDTQTHGVERYK